METPVCENCWCVAALDVLHFYCTCYLDKNVSKQRLFFFLSTTFHNLTLAFFKFKQGDRKPNSKLLVNCAIQLQERCFFSLHILINNFDTYGLQTILPFIWNIPFILKRMNGKLYCLRLLLRGMETWGAVGAFLALCTDTCFLSPTNLWYCIMYKVWEKVWTGQTIINTDHGVYMIT